jgi:RND family efflux transporter MFP subunit
MSFKSSLLLMVVVSTALFTSCAKKSDGQEASTATSDVTVVPVAKVVRSSLASDMTVTGEFIPYQEIDVMAKVAGYIRSIRVDIGDRVREGQLLAELEVPEMQDDLTRAAAAVQASESDIVTARDDLNRAKSAYEMTHLSYTRIQNVATKEPGLVPQQEVDEAHSKDLVAQAEVSAAQSTLQAAERKTSMSKAEQARWKTLEKYTVITAPFTGVITKRYANTGAMIQAGTASQSQAMPVVRLSQNDLLRLILPVPESAVPNIRIGETVEVDVSSLQKTFPGRITRFANTVQMSTRTMDTEVDVPNASLVLVPGMYAQVKLQLKRAKETLAVPLDAVEETNGAAQVYAVEDSVVRIVPVITGMKTAQEEEIQSGIHEGALVIVGRHAGLQNGQKVKPKLVALGGD